MEIFRLSRPGAAAKEAQEREEKAAAKAVGRAPIRTLIVDHPRSAKVIQRFLLPKPNITILGIAKDAYEAIEKAGKLRPDLVLIELLIPGGGLETTRSLHQVCPGARVILLSVDDTANVRQSCQASGADGFVPKLRLFQELCPAIECLFSGFTS
jgi:DNA-binding NarL/FixJ family response regulator